MKNYAFLLFAFLFLSACNDNKAKLAALEKETNELHDTAMKDVAELNRVARGLKEFMMSATMTPEQSQAYTNALMAMGKAEDDMNSWMAKLKNTDSMTTEEAIQYLEEQKAFLIKNGQDIRNTTAAGKALPQ